MLAIVYFATFIFRPNHRYIYFGFISLVVTLRVQNNPEPCILILRLIIPEARGRHCPHESPAIRICMEILSRVDRLEGVLLGRNSLNPKEVFVFCGEVIQFLSIK